jgi:hypothetical protein
VWRVAILSLALFAMSGCGCGMRIYYKHEVEIQTGGGVGTAGEDPTPPIMEKKTTTERSVWRCKVPQSER